MEAANEAISQYEIASSFRERTRNDRSPTLRENRPVDFKM